MSQNKFIRGKFEGNNVKEKQDNNTNSSSIPKVEEPKKEEKKNQIYGDIPSLPTQDAIQGIKFDFNSGFRIFFPANTTKKYHLRFKDVDSNLVLYDSDVENGNVISSIKKFYIHYQFEITYAGDNKIIYEHTMDLKDKKVVVQFPVGTIGDSIGWFSYIERFQKKHQCKLILVISQFLIDLVKKQYPDYEYITKEEVANQNMYASYYLGLFFKGDVNFQPMDFRQAGLHRTAGMILGLRTTEELKDIPPRLDLSAKRKIKEKYVVIAAKASAQCKYWNNPDGWHKVITFLKDNGYRVLCIDKERFHGINYVINQIPWGCEDFTGDIPLQERVDIIKDADFFVGLASGLSWLAWACNVPVVMISGFSLPNTEFYTPYRVINYDGGCVGCWDDMRENFDHNNFLWCPRKTEDNKKFECTKIITGEQVIDMIKTIPTFRPKEN